MRRMRRIRIPDDRIEAGTSLAWQAVEERRVEGAGGLRRLPAARAGECIWCLWGREGGGEHWHTNIWAVDGGCRVAWSLEIVVCSTMSAAWSLGKVMDVDSHGVDAVRMAAWCWRSAAEIRFLFDDITIFISALLSTAFVSSFENVMRFFNL
jgi:hypothetical protein